MSTGRALICPSAKPCKVCADFDLHTLHSRLEGTLRACKAALHGLRHILCGVLAVVNLAGQLVPACPYFRFDGQKNNRYNGKG